MEDDSLTEKVWIVNEQEAQPVAACSCCVQQYDRLKIHYCVISVFFVSKTVSTGAKKFR